MGRPLTGTLPKTERVSFVTTRQIKSDLGKIATIRRTSVNAILNEVWEDFVKSHQDLIDRYNEIFGEFDIQPKE